MNCSINGFKLETAPHLFLFSWLMINHKYLLYDIVDSTEHHLVEYDIYSMIVSFDLYSIWNLLLYSYAAQQ